ncbi:MAG: aminoglycoside phosphotransferase family protein [Candidatus Rokubacteria bacterium]|nr:aminoglycoside phosphotransferase family protein [Candidatus Rokubacteria bacterium]
MTPALIAHGARVLLRVVPAGAVADPVWTPRVIDRVRGRHMVVEYALAERRHRGRHPVQRVIGKFYADGTGQRTYRVMREIASRLAAGAPTPPLAVPRPLAYDRARRLLLQERAPGVPFPMLVERGSDGRIFRLAGAALACLHSLPLRLGRESWLPDHLRELVRPHPRSLVEAFPEYRGMVESVLAAIAARERGWRGRVRATPLHRDFHLRQLIRDADRSDRVWLIDWDFYAKGDPAFDVGYFVAYLRSHLGSRAEAAVNAFLGSYTARRPASAVLARLSTYEAFNYLRRACRRFRLRDTGWQVEMRAMLARAADSL